MQKETGFVLLATAALAAIIIWEIRKPNASASDSTPAPNSTDPQAEYLNGPAYMVYNTPPWWFAPPVGNFLPAVASGTESQAATQTMSYDGTCYGNCGN